MAPHGTSRHLHWHLHWPPHDTALIMQINHWLIRERLVAVVFVCCCCFRLLLRSQTQNILHGTDQEGAFFYKEMPGNVLHDPSS